MAFALANLNPIGGQSRRGKAPQMFGYRTADSHATVDSAGYFNNASKILEIGDIIFVTVVDDVDTPTTCSTYGSHVVLSNAAGVVDVSNVTVGVVTDTD